MAREHVCVKAYGKVNLGLDVTGKRKDGYHLLRMIMQTVDIYDEIYVRKEKKISGESRIVLNCDNKELPSGPDNLAYKAAERVLDKYDIKEKIFIDIKKNIPIAAGMAGGSADAAAVIKALDELFELHMTKEQMDEIAVRLGADVPFCLRKGTYLAEGIGEELTKIADLRSLEMVIIKPDFGISTKWAYEALDLLMERSEVDHPDIDALVEAVNDRDIDKMAKKMRNILEYAAIEKFPEIQKIKDRLMACGAAGALMSGSGPTVFGIFTDRNAANVALDSFRGENYGKFKVEF